jgi:dTDP-4-amino-4,6-dideoxygalactose transaminase
VPALTFCATANAVLHAGATPVPVDVERGTMNIDPADAARKITRRTRAMVPVHFAGRACDMRALRRLARDRGLRIIEDCAHAIETESHGEKAGTWGDLACFSFYATKNLTTGEGGMLLTRSAKVAARLKRLALHGMSQDAWKRFGDAGYKHYDVVELGYKYNLTDLAAAIGLPQLKAIEANGRRRQAIWGQYQQAFADLQDEGLVELPCEPGTHENMPITCIRR